MKDGEVIGYEYVHIGKMMQLITDGLSADEALKKPNPVTADSTKRTATSIRERHKRRL